jgi:propionate CoA-transferase
MELTEVAPGIDIERDILAQMDFVPIIRAPRVMDARLFGNGLMRLEEMLLAIGLADRVTYDVERNILFVNLEGMHVKTRADSDRIKRSVEERCQEVGRKVNLVANYDNFTIDASVEDTYAAMINYLETNYYITSSRYTKSVFVRLKLGAALTKRHVAAHIFASADEAIEFVGNKGKTDLPISH